MLVFTQELVTSAPLNTVMERPIEENQESCSYYGETYLTKEKDAYELEEMTEQGESLLPSLKGNRPTLGESKSTQQTTNQSQLTNLKLSLSKKSFGQDSSNVVWSGKTAGPLHILCKVAESQTKMRRVVQLLCRLCNDV